MWFWGATTCIESVCIAITEYLEYLETQCKRNTRYQKNENSPTEMPLDDFVISPIKQYVHTNESKVNALEKLMRALQDTSVYKPLEMKKYIITNCQNFHNILCHVKDKGYLYYLQTMIFITLICHQKAVMKRYTSSGNNQGKTNNPLNN